MRSCSDTLTARRRVLWYDPEIWDRPGLFRSQDPLRGSGGRAFDWMGGILELEDYVMSAFAPHMPNAVLI